MTVERVTWTALPNHTSADGQLRLSVFVSPRLMNLDGSATERKLGEFPAFAKWPTTLAGLEFEVEFDPPPPHPLGPLSPSAAADDNLWGRIFPDSTPVSPFVYQDHAWKNLHVFPVRPVLHFLEGVYGALAATSPTDLPSIDDPGSPLQRIGALGDLPSHARHVPSFVTEHKKKHKQTLEPGQLKPLGEVIVDPAPSGDIQALSQAYRFYHRPGNLEPHLPHLYEEKKPEPPKLDFHAILSMLGDQPEVLRRLGLIVDLELPAGTEIAPVGRVRVSPSKPVVGGPPPPWTRYEHEGIVFGAKPRDGFRFHHCLLRLTKEFFDLYQVDIDGAALKVVDFAATLGNLQDPERRSHATPSEAGAPSLRSGGFSISRHGRGDQLLEDLDLNRQKNLDVENDLEVEFDLEDLVRGYRLDVLDEDAPKKPVWRSLHHRRCSYAIADPDGNEANIEFEHEDEGYVKGVAVTSEKQDHPNPSDDLYLHETMFGWDGWSLAAPRPGKRIVEPGEGEDGGSLADHDPAEGNPLSITTVSQPLEGSLPRLRAGHTYSFRARAVDLAGNSLPSTEEDLGPDGEELTIGPEMCHRFEPVPSPTVLRRRIDTEGESLEHLVIRSAPGLDADDYATDPAVLQALADAGAAHVYHEDAQRHLAPPKGSQQMAELLGRFDAAFGGSPADAIAALRVALREEGTFLDEKIVDLATGRKTIPQLDQAVHPPGVTLPTQRGQGLKPGAYVLFTGDAVLLPYLPDPMAVGVAVTAFDVFGNEAFHLPVEFPSSWPELEPFRVRLSQGSMGAAFENGVLEIRLEQAAVLRIRLSSLFDPGDLDKFAIWSWIDPKTNDLETAAQAGRHWMLTPYRILTLTHAVQAPLEPPDCTAITPSRQLGETFASFGGTIGCHARSTGRLDVYADWTEDVDLVTDDLPKTRALGTAVEKQAVAFGFDIEPDEDAAQPTVHWHSQAGWRWCRKCQGLVFGGHGVGVCHDSAGHDFSASGNYALRQNVPEPLGPEEEAEWRWCNKCEALAFAGGSPGKCPATGAGHNHFGSGNYRLVVDNDEAPGQRGWRRCSKCQLLVFEAEFPGDCTAGGGHDYGSSGSYTLRLVASQPVDRVSRHSFGDTKYRRITYHGVATTRFREFFPTTITSEPDRIQSVEPSAGDDGLPRPELVRHILNSARPSAPDVVYVVPTFEWERTDDGPKMHHVRKGNGVRVYLRRPWFSSGDGELLGVVLRNPPPGRVARLPGKKLGGGRLAPTRVPVVRMEPLLRSAPTPDFALSSQNLGLVPYLQTIDLTDPLERYVSDWGSDPVWQAPEPRRYPAIYDFPRHVAHGAHLTLEEVAESFTVSVAGHEVFFEPDRKLWYCDIDVDAQSSYFPFVRLAVARFQPNSLDGAHLSRVVMTDFIQLVPDRIADVSIKQGKADVMVSGVSGRNIVGHLQQSKFDFIAPSAPVPNTAMSVVLQQHDPAIEGELGWRSVGDPVQLDISELNGFHVTWKGSIPTPAAGQGADHRLLLTETETYLRLDKEAGDPNALTSPTDLVRSRIVYADDFELRTSE